MFDFLGQQDITLFLMYKRLLPLSKMSSNMMYLLLWINDQLAQSIFQNQLEVNSDVFQFKNKHLCHARKITDLISLHINQRLDDAWVKIQRHRHGQRLHVFIKISLYIISRIFLQIGMLSSTESTANESLQLAMQTSSQWALRMIEEGKGEELQRTLRAIQTCKQLPADLLELLSSLTQNEVNSFIDRVNREAEIQQIDKEMQLKQTLVKDLDILTSTFHKLSRQEGNGQQAHLRMLAARLPKVQQYSAKTFTTFLNSIGAGSTTKAAFKYFSAQMKHLTDRYIICEEKKSLTRERLMKEGGERSERVVEQEQLQERKKKIKIKQREQQQNQEKERKEKERIKQEIQMSRSSDKEQTNKEKKKSMERNERKRGYREPRRKIKVVAERTSRSQEYENPVRRNSVQHK